MTGEEGCALFKKKDRDGSYVQIEKNPCLPPSVCTSVFFFFSPKPQLFKFQISSNTRLYCSLNHLTNRLHTGKHMCLWPLSLTDTGAHKEIWTKAVAEVICCFNGQLNQSASHHNHSTSECQTFIWGTEEGTNHAQKEHKVTRLQTDRWCVYRHVCVRESGIVCLNTASHSLLREVTRLIHHHISTGFSVFLSHRSGPVESFCKSSWTRARRSESQWDEIKAPRGCSS